jgi:adenylate cyclase
MTDTPKDALKSALARIPVPPSNLSDYIAALNLPPSPPSTTTSTYVRQAEERFEKRLDKLKRILPVTEGRVVPDDDDLIIGGARRLTLSVLFLDICKFSQIDSFENRDQDRVLVLLNLFMAEMLHIVREYEGEFEKNTGDGIMAYFGSGLRGERTQRAVDAAVTMHLYNDEVISPRLQQLGLPAVKFRVGIETGPVTVAKVGVRGDHHSLVAIGNTPNVACKLMTLIPEGGIAIGHYARYQLSTNWQKQTKSIGSLTGYLIRGTTTPYPAWELTYRAPKPSDSALGWIPGVSSSLGGL